jgi:hypothetical protein
MHGFNELEEINQSIQAKNVELRKFLQDNRRGKEKTTATATSYEGESWRMLHDRGNKESILWPW